MKTKILDTTLLIQQAVEAEASRHKYCFVVFNPGEEMIWNELNEIVGKDLEPDGDGDNKVVLIPAKDLKELKAIWGKIIVVGIAEKFEAYQNGKRFTF